MTETVTPAALWREVSMVNRYRLLGFDSTIEPSSDGEYVKWADYAALEAKLAALSQAPEAHQEPVAWQEPELTCPHIERAVMSGELSPAVVDELAAIREINSQLRYGTWALKAQLQALPRPAEQAVTEAMVLDMVYFICDDLLPSFGIILELGRINPELHASVRNALKAAMEARDE